MTNQQVELKNQLAKKQAVVRSKEKRKDGI